MSEWLRSYTRPNILVYATAVALVAGLFVSDSGAHALERNPGAIVGSFAVGGSLTAGIDEKRGTFSVQFPVVALPGLNGGGVSASASYHHDDAEAGASDFGIGTGWRWDTSRVLVDGVLQVAPASGGVYAADFTRPSGLADYPTDDLRFSQTPGVLATRDGVPSERAFAYTLEYPGGMDYFDANGQHIARRTVYDARADWVWDERGRLVELIDDIGNAATLTYSDTGIDVAVTSRSDGVAATSRVNVDAGRLASTTGPAGDGVTFGYNDSGLITSVVSETDAETVVSYDEGTDRRAKVRSVEVYDRSTGQSLSRRTWKTLGEHTASGYPDYANENELWRSGNGEYRYTTELSDGATAIRSEYNAMGLLLDRSVTVTDDHGRVDIQHNTYGYPETQGGGVPAQGAVPGNYGKPTTTSVTVKDATSNARTTTEQTIFDDAGRILTHTTADGAVTQIRYDTSVPEGGNIPVGLIAEQTVTGADGTVSKTVNTPSADRKSIAVSESFLGTVGEPLALTSRTETTTNSDGFISEQRVASMVGESDNRIPAVTRFSRAVDRDRGTTTLFQTDAADTAAETTTQATYDLVSGLVMSSIDVVGRESTTQYDIAGRPVQQKNPAGHVSTFVYGDRVARVTDPRGVTTSTYTDVAGNVIRVTDNIGVVDGVAKPVAGHERTIETRRYDNNNSIVTVTDGPGRETVTTSDVFGRVTSVRGPSNLTHLTRYDDVANTMTTGVVAEGQSLSDALRVTTTRHDLSTRSTTTTAERNDGVLVPENKTVSDGLGRTTSQTASDVTTNVTFAADGTPATTTRTPRDARFGNESVTSSRVFDARGVSLHKTLSTPDQDRAGVRRVTDPAGRTESVINQQGGTTRYEYSADGLTTIVDNAETGVVTRNSYDPLTRQLTLTETANAEGTVSQTAFDYDAVTGVMLSVYDPSNVESTRIRYDYDIYGNTTRIRYPDGNTITHSYDEWGQKTRTTDIAGQITDYEYDRVGLLATVTSTSATGDVSARIDYRYDAYGRTIAVERDNGVTTRYTFTSVGEIATEKTVADDSTVIFDAGYNYDTQGNLTTKTVSDSSTQNGSRAAETTHYVYNAYNQLVESAISSEETLEPFQRTLYELGVAGNVTKETVVTPSETTVRDFESNSLGQTTAITTNGVRAEQQYDAAGNITQSFDGTRYAYNLHNQLETQTNPDGTFVTHAYWANGKRASLANSSGETVGFYWDGAALVNDTRTVDDLSISASYTLGQTRLARTLSDSSESTLMYVSDRHANTVGLVDETGAVVTQYSYSDYGIVTEQPLHGRPLEGAHRNAFQHAGEYADERGVQLLGNRLYVPETAAFTTRDTADQFDLYHYTGGNPITRVDPTGQFPDRDTLVNGALAGVEFLAAVVSLWAATTAAAAGAWLTLGIALTSAVTDAASAALSAAQVVDQQEGYTNLLTNQQAETLSWTGIGIGIGGAIGTGAAAGIAVTIANRSRVMSLKESVLFRGANGEAAAYKLTQLRGDDIQKALNRLLSRTRDENNGIEFIFIRKKSLIWGNQTDVAAGRLTRKEATDPSLQTPGLTNPSQGGSYHESLAYAMGVPIPEWPSGAVLRDNIKREAMITARVEAISGGMLTWAVDGRRGQILVNAYPHSGHFAATAPDRFWSPQVRQDFVDFMQSRGVTVTFRGHADLDLHDKRRASTLAYDVNDLDGAALDSAEEIF